MFKPNLYTLGDGGTADLVLLGRFLSRAFLSFSHVDGNNFQTNLDLFKGDGMNVISADRR